MVERILKFSTKDQSPYPKELAIERLFCPIISIDHLSQHFQDLPVDDILALGDQALLRGLPGCGFLGNGLLSQSINQPDVFGPPIEYFHQILFTLRKPDPSWGSMDRGSCEVLLYLCGHGVDPGNRCLIPDTIKPHPARGDLRDCDPAKCYTGEEEQYLRKFYEACTEVIGASRNPLGFVGGEVYAHQRGFIGVLGILGLWCYVHHSRMGVSHGDHREDNDKLIRHLVIVADSCFSGVWGATLESIMQAKDDCLSEYRELLQAYPVSIQCATNECEASYGGLFTPLWYLLNTSPQQLKRYCDTYKREGVPDDDFETQHPSFISTSPYCPSRNCFDDPNLFVYLHGKQLEELNDDLKVHANKVALDNACAPEVGEFDVENFSPLVRPRVTALADAARCLRQDLQNKQGNEKYLQRDYERTKALLQSHTKASVEEKELERTRQGLKRCNGLLQTAKKSICSIMRSLDDLRDHLFEGAQRSQRVFQHYVLDHGKGLSAAKREDLLTEANCKKLEEELPLRDKQKPIPSGVYVFQGGEGDMSLIITPGQEEVVLIDGTKTADCFKAAWNSTLRYLPRITHIVVTHHDEDHTFGIQLLLARYYVGKQKGVEGNHLPDLSTTFFIMNTRATFTCRNFWHEKEIETLVERFLDSQVDSLIIPGKCIRLLSKKSFFLDAILPRKPLLDEVKDKVPAAGKYTKAVSSRGGTTAANVLSINLVAVWNRDAYLFTGDAHLKDVTEAARDFLHIEKLESFKYVDVPHHGSRHSNVRDVIPEHRGLAGIPADNYLISHRGNHQNPSHETVTDILQSDICQKLHFLYSGRKRALSCGKHKADTEGSWHCRDCVKAQQHCPDCVKAQQPCPNCVKTQQQRVKGKIDTALHANGPFKFFPFE